MTLANLKKVCAAYHQKATSALTVDSVDLFLVAANNVRRNAELLHNFEYARCVATLDINGVTGGSLDDATITNGSSETLTVTGSLTPDATGTYVKAGLFNGYNIYFRTGGTTQTDTFAIWFYSAGGFWALTDMTQFVQISGDYWTCGNVGPIGTYTPGAGTPVGTATVAISSSSGFVRVKEVVAVSRQRPDGTYIPLDFARSDIPIERDRTELEFSDNLFPYLRYPSDARINARGTSSSIIQRGRRLEIHPYYAGNEDTTFNVRLESYGWLADYDSSTLLLTEAPDFFVQYGAQYMQWAIVNELNYLFQTFVPREDGQLTAPEQKAEKAWRDLLLWDTYQVDANTTRSR